MKPIAIPFRHIVILAFLLLGGTCITSVADEIIPRISIEDAPLSDTIKTLARQANLNLILDPRIPGSGSEPGRSAKQPDVTAVWTNTTAKAALTALLKDYKLKMVSSSATTVTRIVPADANVEPVSADKIGTKESKMVPLLVLEDVPLEVAFQSIARQGDIKIAFDPSVAEALEKKGSVSIRWEKITSRQAFAALLDNYDLVMTSDPATLVAQITLKPKKD